VTSLTLAVIAGICARSHHKSTEDTDVFTISPAVAYFMAAIGLLIGLVPLLPGAAGDISRIRFVWYFAPFSVGAFAVAIYLFRYQVVVKDQTLTFGAFFRRSIPFSNVIDWDVIKGSRSAELWVYLLGGERLKFSGLLSDFDELTGMINSHMAIPPHGQPDSQAKLSDREKRVRDNRRANWLAFMGLALVAAVIIILSKLRLMS
jgi:hypothetical protein